MVKAMTPTDGDKPLSGDLSEDHEYLRSVFAKQLSGLTGIPEKKFNLAVVAHDGQLVINGFQNNGKHPTREEVRKRLMDAGINSTERGDLIVIDSNRLDEIAAMTPGQNGKGHAVSYKEQVRDRLVETAEKNLLRKRHEYGTKRMDETNQILGRGTRIIVPSPDGNGNGRG